MNQAWKRALGGVSGGRGIHEIVCGPPVVRGDRVRGRDGRGDADLHERARGPCRAADSHRVTDTFHFYDDLGLYGLQDHASKLVGSLDVPSPTGLRSWPFGSWSTSVFGRAMRLRKSPRFSEAEALSRTRGRTKARYVVCASIGFSTELHSATASTGDRPARRAAHSTRVRPSSSSQPAASARPSEARPRSRRAMAEGAASGARASRSTRACPPPRSGSPRAGSCSAGSRARSRG